jgi:predicted alpha/beta-hydrolase family hydrolase
MRDPFGSLEDVASYGLPERIRVHWLEDGDHDFKPRKSSGRMQQANWDDGVAAVVAFVAAL